MFSFTDKRCEKILSNQTPEQCEKRLQHCCKSGRKLIKKKVCATTRYGIGMIFYNSCSLHYIRCLYPEICFLKRDLSHQHCQPYQGKFLKFYILLSCFYRAQKTSNAISSRLRKGRTLSGNILTEVFKTINKHLQVLIML